MAARRRRSERYIGFGKEPGFGDKPPTTVTWFSVLTVPHYYGHRYMYHTFHGLQRAEPPQD